MEWVALDLECPAIAHPDDDATAGGALAARAGKPQVLSWQAFFRRSHIRFEVLCPLEVNGAAADDDRRRGQRTYLKEFPSA